MAEAKGVGRKGGMPRINVAHTAHKRARQGGFGNSQ